MQLHHGMIAAALGLMVAGCPPTAPVERTNSRKLLSHTWVVKPGKFAEANLKMDEGVQLSATFASTDLLLWNVHSHPGGQEAIHQQGEGTAGTIEFTAPAAGTYSLLWQNDNSSSVKLEVKIEGKVRLESWLP